MKKYALLFLLAVTNLLQSSGLSAQPCDPATPTYSIDLTGKPDSVWISPAIVRYGLCCSYVAPSTCIEFNFILDSASRGIVLNIASGPIPPGGLYFDENCGVQTALGTELIAEPGFSHRITFCKPGSNSNTYSITAIPKVPIAVFSASSTTICMNDCINFTDISVGYRTGWNWDFGDGNTSISQNPTHCYSAPGVYTVSLIAYNISGTDTTMQTITVNPNPVITVNSPTICSGDNASITASGGSTYLWSTGATTDPIFVSPISTTSYTVTGTDFAGCTGTAVSLVTVDPLPTISVNSPSVCSGVTANLTAVGADSYSWSAGAIPTGINTADVTPLTTTSYTVTGTSAGCSGTAVSTVTIFPNTDIIGAVSYSGGALISGINTVELYEYFPLNTLFNAIQTVTLDPAGQYHFSNVNPGDYLVKVFNDTAVYPSLIPTYFDGQFLWDSATVVSHNCATNNIADIAMIEVPALTGPGHIAGTIIESDGFRTPGDPIPGVDIKLGRNPGGQLITNTQTNSEGQYSFSGLPVNLPGEYYILYVDIPGLERDSTYTVIVTASETDFPNLDFVADSTTVTPELISVGMNNNFVKEESFTLFPNPATENVLIRYSVENETSVSLNIFNILGVKIADIENKKQSAGEYQLILSLRNLDLNSGVYFVTLETGSKKLVQRLVITK